jgi:citrate lyase subunit beta / citryl-CoA lyase
MLKMSLFERRFRSLLFVPGNRPDLIDKAWGVGTDAVILDLEDSVPEAEKSVARTKIRTALATIPINGPAALVRINSLSTLHWRKDLDELLGQSVLGIVVPKCDSGDEIRQFETVLQAKESERGMLPGSIALFLLIETPRGLIEAPKLAQVSERVAALVFGAEDFCLEMGITRTTDGPELAYARSRIAVSARAYDCLAIDTIYSNFGDSEGLGRDSETAKRAGFSGKLAIHPRQIEIINTAFAATDQQLSEARRVVEAFRRAEMDGQGAIALEGRMIDRPVAERARRLLNLSGVRE